jgi:hypothetical protein
MTLRGSSVSLSIDGRNVRHAIPPAMDPWDVAGRTLRARRQIGASLMFYWQQAAGVPGRPASTSILLVSDLPVSPPSGGRSDSA